MTHFTNLKTGQLLPLRGEEELQTFDGPGQSETSDEQRQHHDVRKHGGEVSNLATTADSLPGIGNIF